MKTTFPIHLRRGSVVVNIYFQKAAGVFTVAYYEAGQRCRASFGDIDKAREAAERIRRQARRQRLQQCDSPGIHGEMRYHEFNGALWCVLSLIAGTAAALVQVQSQACRQFKRGRKGSPTCNRTRAATLAQRGDGCLDGLRRLHGAHVAARTPETETGQRAF